MAAKPAYLEANWRKVKTVMMEPGKLDRLTKECIAVAVSAVNGCGQCIDAHERQVPGRDDMAVREVCGKLAGKPALAYTTVMTTLLPSLNATFKTTMRVVT